MLDQIKDFVISTCQPVMDFCSSMGELGLFILAFIESAFFPIPPDFLYIPMILNGATNPYQLALIATIGSVLGGFFGYAIGFYGGRPIVDKFISHKYLEKAHRLFEEYGPMAILIAAFTPVPYKVFTIAAGMSDMRKREFLIFSTLGRGGRFFVVTFLLVNFSEAIMEHFFKLSLIGAAVLALAFLVWKFRKKLIRN